MRRWPDAVIVVLAVMLAMAFASVCVALDGCAAAEPQAEAEPEPQAQPAVEYRTKGLCVDVTDAWQMHNAGLPTHADVLSWHMYGRWGFTLMRDGTREEHIWGELPGGSAIWDRLYGIEDNPAFNY